MTLRSWLIVPGHSEKQLAQAPRAGADVVVVDLCATVPAAEKAAARALSAEWLRAFREPVSGGQGMARWVRISPFDSGLWREDLLAALAGAADGVILPHAAGPEAVRQLGIELYEFEQKLGVPANSTLILPIVGETPRTALGIADYAEAVHPRLAGLTWRPDGLADALGIGRDTGSGALGDPFAYVRATCLLTARATDLAALDAPCETWEDEAVLRGAIMSARRDGFTGMFAIHPAQVPAINAAFSNDPFTMPVVTAAADHVAAIPQVSAAAAPSVAAQVQPGLMPGLIRRAPILRST
ncbi:HpcH/HpaI aldolase/citrate lyase family protein [Novosphingobium colocasiae]|uniref:Citryl-CoA lyase n=1 Tax=Novosphingobium colocasiae TaxID=1256513 RepID=A0A918PBJ4_9SPHN|nr:aldolase/citrate lyase family protein [Novosphingobium colocasiae]GGY94494.1 citryl-CoA lyase [Novosphingobium colocasiae]